MKTKEAILILQKHLEWMKNNNDKRLELEEALQTVIEKHVVTKEPKFACSIGSEKDGMCFKFGVECSGTCCDYWREVSDKTSLKPLSSITDTVIIDGQETSYMIELAKLFHTDSDYTVSHYLPHAGSYENYTVKCCVENDDGRYMYFSIPKDVHKLRYDMVAQLVDWDFDVLGLVTIK